MDWFKGLTSYEEIRDRYNELVAKYYHRERKSTDEEKQTMSEINNQFSALPAVKEHKAEKTKQKAEAEKEKKSTRGILSSQGYEKFNQNDKITNSEAIVFAEALFDDIRIGGKNNNELERGLLTDYIERSALNQEINTESYNDFCESHRDLEKNDMRLPMEYLNSTIKEISSLELKSYYSDIFFENMKKMALNGATVCIGETGSDDKAEIEFDQDKELDEEISKNPNLTMLKGAVESQLAHAYNFIKKEDVFYNLLQAKQLDFSSASNVRHIILGEEQGGQVSHEVMTERANQILTNILHTQQSSRDKTVHNRDKVSDLTRLYMAYSKSNNGKMDREFGERILNSIEGLRIHSFALGGRKLKQDYITQQKDIDHIRFDLGMNKLNKWQSVAGVRVEIKDRLTRDQMSENVAEPINSKRNIFDDSMSDSFEVDESKKLNINDDKSSFFEASFRSDAFKEDEPNKNDPVESGKKENVNEAEKEFDNSFMNDNSYVEKNDFDNFENPFEALDRAGIDRRRMNIPPKDINGEEEDKKGKEIEKNGKQIFPPVGSK